MKKSITEWYKLLPEPYQTEAIEEALQQGTLLTDTSSIYNALRIGFNWSKSKKGSGYWADFTTAFLSPDNYIITRYEHNGMVYMDRLNDGFTSVELLGILQLASAEVLEQIKGTIKPDVITRTAINKP